jgi:Fe-S cluster assembly protein SufB
MANVDIDLGKYSLGWSDPEKNVFKPEKGLNEDIIRKMSEIKEEPEWMLDFRLKAYKRFLDKPMPEWVAKEKLDSLDFDDIYYYIKPTEDQADSWDMVPDEIKETYEKLGIQKLKEVTWLVSQLNMRVKLFTTEIEKILNNSELFSAIWIQQSENILN